MNQVYKPEKKSKVRYPSTWQWVNHEVGIRLVLFMSFYDYNLSLMWQSAGCTQTHTLFRSQGTSEMSPHIIDQPMWEPWVLSAFSLKGHLLIQIKATVRFCHWNSSSTSAQRLSDLVRCPFFPDNYSPVLGFCPVPCCGGLAARIQLLLCEWQLIKALGFCWRHHHYVIPLQGSVLLAMKPTATRALKTEAQAAPNCP